MELHVSMPRRGLLSGKTTRRRYAYEACHTMIGTTRSLFFIPHNLNLTRAALGENAPHDRNSMLNNLSQALSRSLGFAGDALTLPAPLAAASLFAGLASGVAAPGTLPSCLNSD